MFDMFIVCTYFKGKGKNTCFSTHILEKNRLHVGTETCKKYSVTVIFYYVFHIKPHYFKTLFQSQFLLDFDEIFTNKGIIQCSFILYFQHNFMI